MIVLGSKNYIHEKCKSCIYSGFEVAVGLHPDYGWYVQICKHPEECIFTFIEPTLFGD